MKFQELECGIALAFTFLNCDRGAAPGREGIEGAMDDQNVIDIDMKGAPGCGRCFMLVARYAPQVVASSGTYHRECFEAWYFGRYRKRPRLIAGAQGDRHRFQVRETTEQLAA